MGLGVPVAVPEANSSAVFGFISTSSNPAGVRTRSRRPQNAIWKSVAGGSESTQVRFRHATAISPDYSPYFGLRLHWDRRRGVGKLRSSAAMLRWRLASSTKKVAASGDLSSVG